MREAKILEFINHCEGKMRMKEYFLNFTQLSWYAPTVVVNPRSRMSKFVLAVSEIMVKECCTSMLINNMDTSHLRGSCSTNGSGET